MFQQKGRNMKKYIIIIGMLVMGYVNVFGQNDNYIFTALTGPFKNGKLNYIVGLKNINSLEIGIALGSRDWSEYNLFYSNYHISPEITFINSGPLIGTKLGFSASFILLNIGTQFIHYTDFQTQDFAIRPEIGLTLLV